MEKELRLLPAAQVADKLGVDISTLYKMIKAGKFPAGRRLPAVTGVKWLSTQVDQFILDQWDQAA